MVRRGGGEEGGEEVPSVQHPKHDEHAARAQQPKGHVVVLAMEGLVGVECDEVELVAVGLEALERVHGLAHHEVDVAPRQLLRRQPRVVAIDLEARELRLRRQRLDDGARGVAGEGADVEGLARAREAYQRAQQHRLLRPADVARHLVRHALHRRVVHLLHQRRRRRARVDDEVAQLDVGIESELLPLRVVHPLRVLKHFVAELRPVLELHRRQPAHLLSLGLLAAHQPLRLARLALRGVDARRQLLLGGRGGGLRRRCRARGRLHPHRHVAHARRAGPVDGLRGEA